jgi:hypothetical protein
MPRMTLIAKWQFIVIREICVIRGLFAVVCCDGRHARIAKQGGHVQRPHTFGHAHLRGDVSLAPGVIQRCDV